MKNRRKFTAFYTYCNEISSTEIGPDTVDEKLVENFDGQKESCKKWMAVAGAGDTFTTQRAVIVCTHGRRPATPFEKESEDFKEGYRDRRRGVRRDAVKYLTTDVYGRKDWRRGWDKAEREANRAEVVRSLKFREQ